MTLARDAPPDPWMQHMRRGEWEQAWAISDALLPVRARAPRSHWPRHLQSIWTGAPLHGKRVLVRCYHGLGDTLQFIRYTPLLKAIAAEVIVWTQPKLLPLLRGIDGIDRLLPLHDGALDVDVDFDIDVEIMELPYIFRTTLDTVPASIPYLRAEPMVLASPAGQRRVGLVWKAGDWNDARSIPYEELAPFAQLRGDTTVYILQPDAAAARWDGGFGEYLGEFDLSDYARALKALDLLVTIDSMPAHLAGALGVPTWTLLHHDPDWRWMQNCADSPWYPGMRLFRQRTPGDWTGVIAEVAAELAQPPGKTSMFL